MNSKGIKSVVMTAAFLLGATSAFADTFTSTLTTGNSSISGTPGPYGTVVVNTTGANTATVTFTADAGFVFMAQGLAAVQVNATSWSTSGLSWTFLPGFGIPPPTFTITSAGSGQEDGFGNFNQTFDGSDGFTNGVHTFTFSLTDTAGTWANAASVLGFNSNGFDAAAHVGVCGNATDTAAGACVASNGAFSTGYAGEGNGTITPTPEPASLGLLGTGLVAISGMVMRRKWRPAV